MNKNIETTVRTWLDGVLNAAYDRGNLSPVLLRAMVRNSDKLRMLRLAAWDTVIGEEQSNVFSISLMTEQALNAAKAIVADEAGAISMIAKLDADLFSNLI